MAMSNQNYVIGATLGTVACVFLIPITIVLLVMQTRLNKIAPSYDSSSPCIVVTAEDSPEQIAKRFNAYYGQDMAIHYIHGTDNGDMVACFVGGHVDEVKRFDK